MKFTRFEAWCVNNRGFIRQPVESPLDGKLWIERESQRQLADPRITFNAFGLEVMGEDGWEEWYDDEGRNVDEAFRDASTT